VLRQAGLDDASVKNRVAGKRIMVTSTGGPIESELRGQLCSLGLEVLVIYERPREHPLYVRKKKLSSKATNANRIALVSDVCDQERTNAVLRSHAIETVFHAVARQARPADGTLSMQSQE
jgi:FlaA1/EpsC-like NDP-sugar epimerase